MIIIAEQLRSLHKLFVTFLLLVFTATVASAYTLILRDGRRINIPDQFVVNTSTLTYEVSDGIQVTLHMGAIDVAATERANGERSGALLHRTTQPAPVTSSPSVVRTSSAAQRSVTNRDLESYKQARIAADSVYDQRRKEQGLPSLQETRRELNEMGDRALEQLIKYRQEQELQELRNQVQTMRSEMRGMDNQLDALKAQGYSNYGSPYLYPYAYTVGGFGTGFPFGVVDSGFGSRFGAFGKFGFGNGFHRRIFVSPVGNSPMRPHTGGPGRPGGGGGMRMGGGGGRR